MKPTATKCIDGKRHRWVEEMEHERYKVKWCRKCGCITEFTRPWHGAFWSRCKNDNGIYYIDIPKYLKSKI